MINLSSSFVSFNKLQYIELLKLRGITELKGISIGMAINKSGGVPTHLEVSQVNRNILNNERKKKLEKINGNN
jgi:hypothetical protein